MKGVQTERLMDWYKNAKRDLPWRNTTDPYVIWISEIILQQTRVAQGIPYFYRFLRAFPAVHVLAAADEQEVLRQWEGLGYYSRARNLHAGAKYIFSDLRGQFPDNYNDLLKVKGIGPYTAAAIASICFDEPTPVIDGNVYRVISRLCGVYEDINNAGNRKYFLEILDQLIDRDEPGHFNQAVMELGATVCKPTSPDCDLCPLQGDCFAFEKNVQKDLPVKIKKTKVKSRYFHYLVIVHKNLIGMRRRSSGDVWEGLHEFYLEEANVVHGKPDFLKALSNSPIISEEFKHMLSHQKLFARFYLAEVEHSDEFKRLTDSFELKRYSLSDVVALPKPKLIVNYLTQLND